MKLLTLSAAALASTGVAEAEMTLGEKLNAGLVTLVLGMGTVFAVLIFLWVIIALVGKILGAATKGKAPKKAAEPASVPAAVSEPAPEVESGISDEELVAVMAAAIAAFGGENAPRMRIRSVRRSTNWNK
ncbi:MAG: OadG family protein [Clostridiales bacterium]|nr:OadG family protein [Clostridiales bacterium]